MEHNYHLIMQQLTETAEELIGELCATITTDDEELIELSWTVIKSLYEANLELRNDNEA